MPRIQHISISIYIYIDRYHPLYNRYVFFLYQFNLKLHHFSQFIFNAKKMVFKIHKLEGLWLVGKVVNHLWFMDLRQPRVARLSNVGPISPRTPLIAPSHYLSQCWPRSPYGVIGPQCFNQLHSVDCCNTFIFIYILTIDTCGGEM